MKKGISPLIASVLLLAMVVLIASIIMSWSTTLTKESADTTSNKSSRVTDCSSNIDIRSVYLDFDANVSRVIVRNAGFSTDQLISAVMTNSTGGEALLTNQTNITASPIDISAGQMKTLVFNITGSIGNCADFGEVIVSGSCLADTYNGAPTNC